MSTRKHSITILRHAGFGVLLAAIVAGALPVHAGKAPVAVVDETAHDRAAVIAVDQHWMRAELAGDTAYLQHLLLPAYRSVDARGVAIARAAIIAHAAHNCGSAGERRKVEAWLRVHPSGAEVAMVGDTAIVSFYNPALGSQRGVRSSDIFVYVDGRWRALYSQHSKAGNG